MRRNTACFLATLALCASCATNAARVDEDVDLDSLYVYEPTPAHVTRYRFEFTCRRSPKRDEYSVVIEGGLRDAPPGQRISTIEAISVDGHTMSARDLTQVNDMLPARAVQERPWIMCEDDKIEAAVRVRDEVGTVRFEFDGRARLLKEEAP